MNFQVGGQCVPYDSELRQISVQTITATRMASINGVKIHRTRVRTRRGNRTIRKTTLNINNVVGQESLTVTTTMDGTMDKDKAAIITTNITTRTNRTGGTGENKRSVYL